MLERKEFQLEKELLEKEIDAKLNESDWLIIQALYKNPAQSNKELADKVALSVEGTRSSLKKMYRLFEIADSRNKKLALVLTISDLENDLHASI